MKSKPVEYLPDALLDLAESAAWYEEKQPGVGGRLQEAVQLTVKNFNATRNWVHHAAATPGNGVWRGFLTVSSIAKRRKRFMLSPLPMRNGGKITGFPG